MGIAFACFNSDGYCPVKTVFFIIQFSCANGRETTLLEDFRNRPLSHGGHFESQENKKLCFCTSSLALDERLALQNRLFQHCVIKVYTRTEQEYKPCDLLVGRRRISVSSSMEVTGSKKNELDELTAGR